MNILQEPEATELLRLPKGTLPNLRRNGGGPSWVKLGKRVVYRREDLEAWVKRCTRGCADDAAIADKEVAND